MGWNNKRILTTYFCLPFIQMTFSASLPLNWQHSFKHRLGFNAEERRKQFTHLAQETRSKADVLIFWLLHSFSTFCAKNALKHTQHGKEKQTFNHIVFPLIRTVHGISHHSEQRWWGWRWPVGRYFPSLSCPWCLCQGGSRTMSLQLSQVFVPPPGIDYEPGLPHASCYENVALD